MIENSMTNPVVAAHALSSLVVQHIFAQIKVEEFVRFSMKCTNHTSIHPNDARNYLIKHSVCLMGAIL